MFVDERREKQCNSCFCTKDSCSAATKKKCMPYSTYNSYKTIQIEIKSDTNLNPNSRRSTVCIIRAYRNLNQEQRFSSPKNLQNLQPQDLPRRSGRQRTEVQTDGVTWSHLHGKILPNTSLNKDLQHLVPNINSLIFQYSFSIQI